MNCFFNLFLDNFFYYEYTATIVLLHLTTLLEMPRLTQVRRGSFLFCLF
jgi:hypothetical protein